MPIQDYNPNELYPSKYLKGDELSDGAMVAFTITDMKIEHFEGKNGNPDKDSLVLFPAERGLKPIILNKTLFAQVAAIHGQRTSQWADKVIYLGAVRQMSFGEMKWLLFVADRLPNNVAASTTNGVAPQSAMTQLRLYAIDQSGAEACTPAQILCILEAQGYEKNAPVVDDVERCKGLIDGYLEANKFQLPGTDKPKPGQQSNATHNGAGHAKAVAAGVPVDEDPNHDPFEDA